MKNTKLVSKYWIFVFLLVSCNSGIKKGNKLSQADLNYISEIGLVDKGEQIFLFASQSDNKTSGNFITNKRLASYWIDEQIVDGNINSAFYHEIDTILTKDLSSSWTYASFLKVIKKDSTEFKVFVHGDSKKINQFFEKAVSEWEKRKK